MTMDITAVRSKSLVTRSVLLDVFGLLFIYFVPTISHMLSVPLYLIEPMRIMLILAIVHTTRKNAYLIALTLPLFSFLVSGHPIILKTILITAELVLNVWLFYFFSSRWKNFFFSILLSITLSKVAYYILKYMLISFAFIESGLVSTPLYLQAIMLIIFSSYASLVLSSMRRKSTGFVDPTR